MNVARTHAYRFVYLRSEHWQNLRVAALARQRGKCTLCRKQDSSNDVHHINYKRLFDVKVSDLVVLCRKCHGDVHQTLEECVSIKKAKASHKKWRLTRLHFLRKRRRMEKLASDLRKSAAIKAFKQARAETGVGHLVKRVKYRFIYQFHRERPDASTFEWMLFTWGCSA